MKIVMYIVVLTVVVSVAIAALILIAGRDPLVEYVPVVFDDTRRPPYRYAPELNTPEHQAAFVHVLRQTRHEVEVDDGRVLIRRSFARDRDFVMNFTSRAEEKRRAGKPKDHSVDGS